MIDFRKLVFDELAKQDRNRAWLARRAHVNYDSLCRWLKGKQSIKDDMLARMLLVLGIDRIMPLPVPPTPQ